MSVIRNRAGVSVRSILTIAALLSMAAPAIAQTPRVTISAGAAAQPGTASFANVAAFPYFAETALLEGAYAVADGIAFDVGAGVRVWRNLAVRFGVTRVSRDTASETTGQFPHPLYLNQFREGKWSSSSLDRSELGVHLSAAWEAIQSPRLSVSVFGGPTLFNFNQAVVQSVDVIQSYPYDTIDAQLNAGKIAGTAMGFHAGVDVGWFFTRHVGVGGQLRFTNGTKKGARIGDGDPFDLDLGGAQGGGGIRLRF